MALFVAITIDFFFPHLLSGDPATTIIDVSGADRMTAEQVESLRVALGLTDAPLWQQYFTFLGHLAKGDLGLSFSHFPAPVLTELCPGHWVAVPLPDWAQK